MAEGDPLLAAQVAGAIVAAALLRASLGDVADVGATLPSGSDGQSFLWETVLTFFLMLVIMAVATDTRAVGEAAAIAIGGTVGLDAMFGGPDLGCVDEPRAVARPCARLRGDPGPLGLPDRTAPRGRPRCDRLPARPWRSRRVGTLPRNPIVAGVQSGACLSLRARSASDSESAVSSSSLWW